MLLTLIGKGTMNKLLLPKIAIGNYWLSDKEKKLINIEGRDGNWRLIINSFIDVIDLKTVQIENNILKTGSKITSKEVILKEDEMYGIYFKETEKLFVLYSSPSYESNFKHYDIKKTSEVSIGNGIHNGISYSNKMVESTHARLFFYEGRWRIENYDAKFGTFVNNQPVEKDTILVNGDIIFIMGLKIIVMGKDLFINNPGNKVMCNPDVLELNEASRNIELKNIEENENIELYSEKDYFFRAPRITNVIEEEKMKIDAPPHPQDNEDMPLILAIGSSLSMGVIMMVSIFNAIDGRVSGTASAKQTATSLIIAVAMLISMLLFPILSQKYNKKRKKRYEAKRQKRYKEYLDTKSAAINKIMNKQRNILFENFVSAEECVNIILNRGPRLWERKIDDFDFLTVRLGTGDVPLKLDIQYPEEQFTMEDDNLVEILNSIVKNSKNIKSAPITLSLVEKNISALIINKGEKIDRFIQSLIIQLIAFQSYEDLKLVFLLKKDDMENLEYVKMLPHVWDNSKQIRFFAYDYDDMSEISKYLEEELQNRLQYKNKDYKSFEPYYLIITNDYQKIENLRIISEILKQKENLGFSILCITNDLMQLPNECKTFVSIDRNSETGMIFENEISSKNQTEVTFDTSVRFFFDKICQAISNIPIKYTEKGQNLLPNTYTFLEMYDVGRIEQLNAWERWNRNDPTLSLRAPVGIDILGMPIMLDIHEKFHGPHGLIAGSTGSGKSEFIITYILSLAVNYHPDDVTFILIDYKGGGLAGAFSKGRVKLPHIVGTITNIDTNDLQRSLVSIQSELRRRQVMFNQARDKIDEGTIDIYKYQKLYHEGIVKKPIPHLLIICDEFAELKQQQEEFMDELISVSRIGRSLGVHLILATQKPAGIVNDQIRSNSKMAVCLKVQDREDSVDVIKRPDAANLKRVGQFFLQVGNDEYFTLGQSAWAGAPYYPSDITEKKLDNSVKFISNIGSIVKEVDDTVQKTVKRQGEQLTNIVKYIYEIAEQNKIKPENLWLENIPETIYVNDIKKKYNVTKKPEMILATVGEYDDPSNQRQGIVNINLQNEGNIVIYGNAESGKETFLSTMVYDLITTYSPEEVNLYLFDFGTEALKIYRDAPQVGDVVFLNDAEKIGRFFDILQNEIKIRKNELLEYNGDYNLYIKTSGKKMPMIVAVINNYEAFSEIYEEKYEDSLLTLTREGIKCGIVFIVSVSVYSSMRYRLTQNFKQRICLQLNNDADYYNIFEKLGRKRPSHIFGRGLISVEDDIYEFQTAKICEPEKYTLFIKDLTMNLKKQNKISANPIPIIPEKITFSDLSSGVKTLKDLPIGITKKDLQVCLYNFKKDFINVITSKNMKDAIQFTVNILEEIKKIKDTDTLIFDAERVLAGKREELVADYISFITDLDENKHKNIICVIIGIDKFIGYLENYNVNDTFKKMEETSKCNIIVVENANRLKNHEYDDWYKNYVSKDNGIWVGNGANSQYLININSSRRDINDNCGSSFGYVIRDGIAVETKLLEMMEKGESTEK